MAVPQFQQILLPLLKLASDGEIHQISTTVANLAEHFSLTEDERRQLIPSGLQERFYNRVTWARTHLGKADLLETPNRGSFKITRRGRQILANKPTEINTKMLKEFEEYRIFIGTNGDSEETLSQIECATPQETIQVAYQTLRNSLADDLLVTVKNCSDKFFEHLVVALLVRMGYGGSLKEAGQAIGRSNDGGVDGIIKQDRLGLDVIYTQAKRWTDSVVSRSDVQSFAGALQGKQANKGVFITTSKFSKPAIKFVETISSKIILIDGTRLAELMIEYELGVTTEITYELKRIDLDYFPDN